MAVDQKMKEANGNDVDNVRKGRSPHLRRLGPRP